ncbi:hypothetical protein, partial [Helicobacter sp.]|uniref:hypothetical protein n=1 Tax=Helicobacter sp. TaxID=218 RepID=UPI00388EAAF0
MAWQSSLPVKLTFSISLVLAAALGLAAQGFDESVMTTCGNNQSGMAVNGNQKICLNTNRGEIPGHNHTTFSNAYMWSNPGAQDITYILRNASINPVTMMFRNKGWAYIRLNRTQYGSVIIKNGGSGDELKGRVEFSIEGGSGNSIGDITHEALSLYLKGGASQVLTVTTLNQNSAGDTQVFNNVTITNANANNGLIHNNGGTITNANINGGEFRQTNGTTDTATLNNGTLDQIDGTISTLNQSGGQAIQTGGTITTANLSGGVFTHNGGTLSNVVLKAGGSGSTFVNGTDSAFADITQEGGNHTIIGKVAKFTLASGSFTNNGSIETLTTGTTTTRALRNA